MIAEIFDERTIANMEVALDRACRALPNGGDHAVRRHIAGEILECAKRGDTALGMLTEAGRRAATDISRAA